MSLCGSTVEAELVLVVTSAVFLVHQIPHDILPMLLKSLVNTFGKLLHVDDL